VPIGWAIDGANRSDVKLLGPTIDAIANGGYRGHIGTLHLDRTLTHRHAALCLATVVLITGKLIVWRNRHQPDARPIR
jgi:hypothetical protein